MILNPKTFKNWSVSLDIITYPNLSLETKIWLYDVCLGNLKYF